MTMELRAMVMFYSALLGATLPFNLFQFVSRRTKTHYWYIVSVCSSQHGLKQIKLCFNTHAGCEAALRSDGRLCLQSCYFRPIIIILNNFKHNITARLWGIYIMHGEFYHRVMPIFP